MTKISVKLRKVYDPIRQENMWYCAGTQNNPDGTFKIGQTCSAPNKEQAIGLWMVTNNELVGLTVERDYEE